MKKLYAEQVQVSGGRDGRARSANGQLDVPLAMPPAIGGSGRGVNPEQLFGAAYAACFTSSVRYVAGQRQLDPGAVQTEATVGLSVADDGRYLLDVSLRVTAPGLRGEPGAAVLAEARRICAFANAVRGNIETAITLASGDDAIEA